MTNGEVRLKILRDENPDDPRHWDNLGTMVCWHRRYLLGDLQPKESPEEYFEQEGLKDDVFILPLYLLDHSCITMKTSSFNDRWDSGQVGWIYVSHKKIKEEYGDLTPKTLDKVGRVLQSEVETYDLYLRGEIFGYIVEQYKFCDVCQKGSWESLDSVWGFYGRDFENNGMKEQLGDYAYLLKGGAVME